MGILSKIKQLFRRRASVRVDPEGDQKEPSLDETVSLVERMQPADRKYCVRNKDGTWSYLNEIRELKTSSADEPESPAPELPKEAELAVTVETGVYEKALQEIVRNTIQTVVDMYRRELRRDTNNWRKMHGLPMRRRLRKRHGR